MRRPNSKTPSHIFKTPSRFILSMSTPFLPIEEHPLEPFLPANAKLLMLGSFPPQKKRWSMDFFYPNLQNDMWRIFGLIFFDNKEHKRSEQHSEKSKKGESREH